MSNNKLPTPIAERLSCEEFVQEIKNVKEPTPANIAWMKYSLDHEKNNKQRKTVIELLQRKVISLENEGLRARQFNSREKAYIRENYKQQNNEQMARALGRPLASVIQQMHKMKLRREAIPYKKRASCRPYTLSERKFLEENYLNMTDKELAEKIGRTEYGIRGYRDRFGLYRFEKVKK